jgi:3-ketosteroid 9alpha-monooxygenase subunit B
VVHETAQACSFVLEVPDELAERFTYRAGQFLTVRVPGPDGGHAARCYSLSSSPHDGGTAPSGRTITITVKRMPAGHGSNWLCDHVTAGSVLAVLPPAGTFTPRSLDANFLLFAAGSGITPVMSVLRSALAAGTGRVVLIYANHNPESVIFAAELNRLLAAHPHRLAVRHWLETGPTGQGRPDADALQALAAPHTGDHEVFVCGPEPFMVHAVTAVTRLGVPAARIHLERFVSPADDPFAAPDELRATVPADGLLEVDLDGEHHRLAWPAGTRMLDVMLDHGLDAPFSCRQGMCGACTARLEKGEVRMLENDVLDAEDLAEGYILACQALPVSERVRVGYD